MRKGIGSFFVILGYIAYAIFGVWGFIIELAIVNHAAGFWGVVIAFIIAPVTLVAAPWYALVAWGNWLPLLIIYGGGIFATVLCGIGTALSGDE